MYIYFVLVYVIVLLSNYLAFMDLIYLHRYALIKKDLAVESLPRMKVVPTMFDRGYPCVNEHSNWNLCSNGKARIFKFRWVHFLWRWFLKNREYLLWNQLLLALGKMRVGRWVCFWRGFLVWATVSVSRSASVLQSKMETTSMYIRWSSCLFSFFLADLIFVFNQIWPPFDWHTSNPTIHFSVSKSIHFSDAPSCSPNHLRISFTSLQRHFCHFSLSIPWVSNKQTKSTERSLLRLGKVKGVPFAFGSVSWVRRPVHNRSDEWLLVLVDDDAF